MKEQHDTAQAADLHPKTADLVQRFAAALADKLAAAEKKYGYSDGWMAADWMGECRLKLREHLLKGDPRDVAAYCAFLWHHDESTALPIEEFEQLFQTNKPDAAQAADSVLEDAGGANWQDISTAPKDGTRFVAVGNNYGLYSEMQHTCIAQWFRGCWIEASDWNETSELKYLTHWMPLLPLPGSAARKQGASHD